MKKYILAIPLFLFTFTKIFAQNEEEKAVRATINQLFEGMRKSDSTMG